MLQIAFYGDKNYFSEQINPLITPSFEEMNKEMNVEVFDEVALLVDALKEGPYKYNLLLIGPSLFQDKRMKLAKKVRQIRGEVPLVFLVRADEDASKLPRFNSFRLMDVLRFKREVRSICEEANEIKKRQATYCTFKTVRGNVTVPAREIVYMMYKERYVEVHTINALHRTKINRFKDVEPIVEGKHFVSIHRACMVNMAYIKEIGSLTMLTTTGERLSVSRYKREQALEAYTTYIKAD